MKSGSLKMDFELTDTHARKRHFLRWYLKAYISCLALIFLLTCVPKLRKHWCTNPNQKSQQLNVRIQTTQHINTHVHPQLALIKRDRSTIKKHTARPICRAGSSDTHVRVSLYITRVARSALRETGHLALPCWRICAGVGARDRALRRWNFKLPSLTRFFSKWNESARASAAAVQC